MPEQDGIGYSESTPQKLEHLAKILEMHVNVTTATRNNQWFWCNSRYHAIDATAGSGECPIYNLKGSPLLWLDALNGKIPFRADFIEREEINYLQLCERIAGYRLPHYVHIHNDDYTQKIPSLLKTINEPLGMIFVDPSGNKPDWPTLELVAKRRPYMEILCYIPAANIKREAKAYNRPISLFKYMKKVGKRYWLIREPMSKHQWTFLLGSNTDLFKDYPSLGFYRTDSQRGREILTYLNYTHEDRAQWEQQTLPLIEPMPNISRIPVTGSFEPRLSSERVECASDARRDQ